MASTGGRRGRTVAQRGAVILVITLIGVAIPWLLLAGYLDPVLAAQITAGLLVPSVILILFWRAARRRIVAAGADSATRVRLQQVASRAIEEFLAIAGHDLIPHPEKCDLEEEAMLVASEYRAAGIDLKVAVPRIDLETDRLVLRQVLHLLIHNALRNGGSRIAIWAAPERLSVKLIVSDDGPGLGDEVVQEVFERLLDLADRVTGVSGQGAGLIAARTLSELIGGQMGYKRDPSWTHLFVRVPVKTAVTRPAALRMPLSAGAR